MTIYIDAFLREKSKRADLTKALSILHNIGFFPVLMEASLYRAGNIGGADITATAAVQFGFTSGYSQCIKDLYDFLNTFDNIQEKKPQIEPDYGAIKNLKEQGFSNQEIKDARSSTSQRHKK